MNLSAPILHAHRWIGASLQRKLVLAIAGLLIAMSALFLMVLSSAYQDRLVAEHRRASLQINGLLQAALENAMLKRDIPGLRSILADLGRQDDIARVMILNPDLEVRFSSDTAPADALPDPTLARAALTSRTIQTTLLQDPQAGEVLRSVNPVHNKPPCQTCHGQISRHPINGLLVVDYKAASIRREARASAITLAGLGLGIVVAVSLGIWYALVRLVLMPLARVEQATMALADGAYETKVIPRGHDEIARLSGSFNQMAERLSLAHDELQAATDFLQALIDAVPDGIRVIAPDFTILKANAAYCTLVGQHMQAVLGRPCYRSSHGRDSPCAHTLICCPVVELCQKEGSALTAKDRFQRADGSVLHVEVSSASVEMVVNGVQTRCVVESIRNLDAEASISHEERLSEIGLLAAGVAHEIYNPLSSIDLGLSALKTDIETGKPLDNLDYFDAIQTEIQNCIRITDTLLLLSAPQGSPDALIELDRLVPEVLALLHYEARQHRIDLQVEIAPGLRILGSDSDLRMLVINLAMNAIHAMPEGGPMQVTARRENGEVVLRVRDRGVGIAPEHLNDIFMPFWSRRADASSGRGLGLSIVSAIVKRHGARITVESTPGQGSEFAVHFPDADAEPGAARPDPKGVS